MACAIQRPSFLWPDLKSTGHPHKNKWLLRMHINAVSCRGTVGNYWSNNRSTAWLRSSPVAWMCCKDQHANLTNNQSHRDHTLGSIEDLSLWPEKMSGVFLLSKKILPSARYARLQKSRLRRFESIAMHTSSLSEIVDEVWQRVRRIRDALESNSLHSSFSSICFRLITELVIQHR